MLPSEAITLPKSRLPSIAFGQALALALACMAVVTEELADNRGVNAPVAMVTGTYLCLCVVHALVPRVLNSNVLGDPPDAEIFVTPREWVGLGLIALCDLEANFLVVYAYKFTTITSVSVLASFSVPVVFGVSRVAFGTSHTLWQYSAVGVCLIGMIGLVFADSKHQDALTTADHNTTDLVKGDALVLGGATLYAFANVGTEHALSQFERPSSFLGRFSGLAALLGLVQTLVLEDYSNLSGISTSTVFLLMVFWTCATLFYSFTSIFVKRHSAVVFNLSLLSTNAYALLAGVFLFDQPWSVAYVVCFTLIMVGLIAFNLLESQVSTIVTT